MPNWDAVAEAIVRTDLHVRAVEASRRECAANDDRVQVRALTVLLDRLREVRTEMADSMYAEFGVDGTARMLDPYRQDLDHLYGR